MCMHVLLFILLCMRVRESVHVMFHMNLIPTFPSLPSCSFLSRAQLLLAARMPGFLLVGFVISTSSIIVFSITSVLVIFKWRTTATGWEWEWESLISTLLLDNTTETAKAICTRILSMYSGGGSKGTWGREKGEGGRNNVYITYS